MNASAGYRDLELAAKAVAGLAEHRRSCERCKAFQPCGVLELLDGLFWLAYGEN